MYCEEISAEESFEECPECHGRQEIFLGMTAGVYPSAGDPGEPPEEILETCGTCKGEGCVPADPMNDDEEIFEDECDDEPFDGNGNDDADFAFASAGFGTDEDYGDFSGCED